VTGEFVEPVPSSAAFSLDALEVGSRFRLFHFLQREDGQT
jgi:hypothetical protein